MVVKDESARAVAKTQIEAEADPDVQGAHPLMNLVVVAIVTDIVDYPYVDYVVADETKDPVLVPTG